MHKAPTHSCHHETQVPLWQNKNLWLIAIFAGVMGVSLGVPALQPLRMSLLMYLQAIWWAILLGLLLGGVIDRYVPQAYVLHLLARRKKRTILYAVSFGFLMSVCSHGILALAVQLYKKGASTAAVITFLLASPWANLPITLLLFSFFGVKAFFFIVGAIGIAMTTGLCFQILEYKGWVEVNPIQASEPDHALKPPKFEFPSTFSLKGIGQDLAAIFKSSLRLADMILWWILLGALLAGIMNAYVPSTFFQQWMGPSIAGLLMTLLAATVIEVCSEGTTPIAFELYRQTGAFGNAFVFLMAGVVTDYTEIGLIWMQIGRRAALWLPLISVPQVILLGVAANTFF